MALERIAPCGRRSPNPINWRAGKKSLLNPVTWMLASIYTAMLIAPSGTNYFNLWLKSLTHPDGTSVWSVNGLNAVPIGGFALQMASVWFFSTMADVFRTRWQFLVIQCIIGIPTCIMLSIWDGIPTSAKYWCFFSMYICTASGPCLWAWLSDMLPSDAEQRALIIGISISVYYAFNAWTNPLIFPAWQAPHYHAGYKVCLGLWVFCLVVIASLRTYQVRVIEPQLCQEQSISVQIEPNAELEENAEDDKGTGTQSHVQPVLTSV